MGSSVTIFLFLEAPAHLHVVFTIFGLLDTLLTFLDLDSWTGPVVYGVGLGRLERHGVISFVASM